MKTRRTDYGDYSIGGNFLLYHERYVYRRRELESIGLSLPIADTDAMERIAIGATPEAWRMLMNEIERQLESRRASL